MNATRCHVELSKSPTPEQVQEVEDRLNLYIRRNYPIHVTFTDERPATLPNGKPPALSLLLLISPFFFHLLIHTY